jgi:hypothetical protein
MPVEVNSAAVRWSNVQLPGEISRASAPEKSAEVIVVGKTSRGRDARSNNDTGGLTPFLRPCGQASHLAEPLQRPWHSTDEGPNQ